MAFKSALRCLLGVAFLVNACFACVGDPAVEPPPDPADGGGTVVSAGAEGGECFANGTCLGTLACRSNRCVDLGTAQHEGGVILFHEGGPTDGKSDVVPPGSDGGSPKDGSGYAVD